MADRLTERRRLDIGSRNPRLQCAACGRWMRLHGKDEAGNSIQRFYGGCNVTEGDHPFDGDVCSDCCPTKCAAKLGCEAVQTGSEFKCDRCKSLWVKPTEQAGFRPSSCAGRRALQSGGGRD